VRLTVAALAGTVGSERGHVEARRAVPSSTGVSPVAEFVGHPTAPGDSLAAGTRNGDGSDSARTALALDAG